MTFLLQSDWCVGSQVPLGPGYSLISATVCRLWAGKAIAGGTLPTVVARDVTSYTSYQTYGRRCMRSFVTAYVIYWWYKSGCTPVPGSLFVAPVARELKYPTSQ